MLRYLKITASSSLPLGTVVYKQTSENLTTGMCFSVLHFLVLDFHGLVFLQSLSFCFHWASSHSSATVSIGTAAKLTDAQKEAIGCITLY